MRNVNGVDEIPTLTRDLKIYYWRNEFHLHQKIKSHLKRETNWFGDVFPDFFVASFPQTQHHHCEGLFSALLKRCQELEETIFETISFQNHRLGIIPRPRSPPHHLRLLVAEEKVPLVFHRNVA